MMHKNVQQTRRTIGHPPRNDLDVIHRSSCTATTAAVRMGGEGSILRQLDHLALGGLLDLPVLAA
eukprot:9087534-Pyramimonas_sp.AAC.1